MRSKLQAQCLTLRAVMIRFSINRIATTSNDYINECAVWYKIAKKLIQKLSVKIHLSKKSIILFETVKRITAQFVKSVEFHPLPFLKVLRICHAGRCIPARRSFFLNIYGHLSPQHHRPAFDSLIIVHFLDQFQRLYLHRRIARFRIQKWPFAARTASVAVTVPWTATFAALILVGIECHDLLPFTVLIVFVNVLLMASVIGGLWFVIVVRMMARMLCARFYRIVWTVRRACVQLILFVVVV